MDQRFQNWYASMGILIICVNKKNDVMNEWISIYWTTDSKLALNNCDDGIYIRVQTNVFLIGFDPIRFSLFDRILHLLTLERKQTKKKCWTTKTDIINLTHFTYNLDKTEGSRRLKSNQTNVMFSCFKISKTCIFIFYLH